MPYVWITKHAPGFGNFQTDRTSDLFDQLNKIEMVDYSGYEIDDDAVKGLAGCMD